MAGLKANKGADSENDGRHSQPTASEAQNISHQEEHMKSDDERSVDDRSVAADSWSVKSEYGSTLDGDDTRHHDVTEAIAAVIDEEDGLEDADDADEETEPSNADDADEEKESSSVLGLRSHWDATYTEELRNFQELGNPGEIWFGADVLEVSSNWITRLSAATASGMADDQSESFRNTTSVEACFAGSAAGWRVVDLGTGNGLLLHALAKRGFTNLVGTDYSQAGLDLAKAVAQRSGFPQIQFLIDDVLDSKLDGHFNLVLDKGTLDAVKLHPNGKQNKKLYRKTVEKLTAPGGFLVITSCNTTKDELVADITGPLDSPQANGKAHGQPSRLSLSSSEPLFEYFDHVRTYPTFRFGGVVGSRVCTVAFRRKGM